MHTHTLLPLPIPSACGRPAHRVPHSTHRVPHSTHRVPNRHPTHSPPTPHTYSPPTPHPLSTHSPHLLPTHSPPTLHPLPTPTPHPLPTHSPPTPHTYPPPTPHLQSWLVMPAEPTQVCQWHGLYILRGGLGELLELETRMPHSQ